MPNHVYNILNLTGPKEDILSFSNAVSVGRGDDEGIIRAFIPFPAELEGREILNKEGESIGRAFTDEGYKWCLNNWGTKWGDYETDVLVEPNELPDGSWAVSYTFVTAWSPADEAFTTIAKMFPTLTFDISWEEEGYQSIGAFVAKGDKHVKLYTVDAVPEMPENMWEDSDAEEDFREKFLSVKSSLVDAAFDLLVKQLDSATETVS